MSSLRIAFLLPGLGRIQRGAETAFIELARALSSFPQTVVELFGSGRDGVGDQHIHEIPCINRSRFERWPKLPTLRGDTYYEELSWVLRLSARRSFRPGDFDIAVTCCYPWINWFLQDAARRGGPKQIFVTQNGDWPCLRKNREYRWFNCDGLVCTNPEYYERQRTAYRATLIPNGVDPEVFRPRSSTEDGYLDERIPRDRPVVLLAAALTPTKRVLDGIRVTSMVEGAFALIVGDGPERREVAHLADQRLPGRHLLLGSVPREQMPSIFRRADAFLHMSREEPFGIVYLEAAATGLPIVAFGGPNPRWILGDAALYSETADLEATALTLRKALSPDVRADLGAAARRRVVDGWTWNLQAERYREFFEEVLAAGTPTQQRPRHRGPHLHHRAAETR
ncbi:MAG: glycosyltransferase family 4 protein [Isosphaeraceae bacterium]|nr:glycosyltransferase family 4 protein [Isosphaeraceae bacterium]